MRQYARKMQERCAANDEVFNQRRCRTLPILPTLSYVPGYPDKLRIYLTNASPYWQVRCFYKGAVRTKSTQTVDKKRAFANARKFYEELISTDVIARLVLRNDVTADVPLFNSLIPNVLELEQGRVKRGELSEKAFKITCYRMNKSVIPWFGKFPVEQISYLELEKYVAHLSGGNIKGVAIGQYLVVVRKVLQYALHANIIKQLPPFPKVKANRIPRGGFTINEYRLLLQTSWRMRGQPFEMHTRNKQTRVSKHEWITVAMSAELTRIIGFMVNSFVRPSDVKLLQHKHVEIIHSDNRYLRLTLPETKKHDKPIVTMPAAVGIYKRQLDDLRLRGYDKPDDFVFFPEFKNREHAMRHMDFLFGWLLELTGLKRGQKGQRRTLYSLRHTAITFRLLYGQGIDVLTLARNARTSVEMVERFYASTLNGEMNVDMLHSKRSKD